MGTGESVTKILLFLLVLSVSPIAASVDSNEGPSDNSAGEPVRKWNKHTQKLTTYESDISIADKELKGLIQKKNSGQKFLKDEKGQKLDILKAIVAAHAKKAEAIQKYNAERKELMYRYPGEGEWVQRKYLPMREQNLEEVEREVGLDGQLTQIKRQMDEKYAELRREKRLKTGPESAPADKKSYSEDPDSEPQNESKRLKLVK